MTASCTETYLPTILTKYELKDIYNAYKFGLFYQALPDKSLRTKASGAIVESILSWVDQIGCW